MIISYVKRHWKLLLNLVTILALVVLAFAIRHQLADTFRNLGRVNTWVLLLLLPVEALNYHAQAKLYQRLFATVDGKIPYSSLLKISLELNFVNHVFPSGGVSGISYFGFRLREEGIKATRATLVQTMKLILLFVSFELLLLFGVVALAAMGRVSDLVILIASVMATSILFGTAIFAYVIGSQARIHAFLTGSAAFLNWTLHIIRPRRGGSINIDKARQIFEDFHQDYVLMKSHWRELQAPFWWAFVANLTEVLAIYVVYIAFGSWVNIGAVIIAYSVANFAGLVSVLPGGAGIYEALMTAVLITAGVPAALSLPVTVMYRVLNTLIQVPPGYILYHQTLHKPPQEAHAE
jgi:uncharacterized protein (TIRG00374 family)